MRTAFWQIALQSLSILTVGTYEKVAFEYPAIPWQANQVLLLAVEVPYPFPMFITNKYDFQWRGP
jgi:hypothetical protein